MVQESMHVREFTFKAVSLGILLGVIFGIGNTYLGLKVGLTVSASIPAAVISMALLRAFSRSVTILENNIVQTIASAGESLAAGIIFTIPALFLLGAPPSLGRIFLIALLGGLLGVLLMVPLRHTLMVEEHENLPFPEGTACAEILRAREGSASHAMLAIWGLIIGVIDKVLMGIAFLWNEVATWTIGSFRINLDTTPALLGVGYIIGTRYALILLAGGALGWWVLIPLISMFGAHGPTMNLGPQEIWSQYVRSIGTGAVAIAGVVSLLHLAPLLYRSLKGHFQALVHELFHKPEKKRTEQDLPLLWVLFGIIVILIAVFVIPTFGFNWLSVLLTLALGFFFVALTSVTVGIVGNSSNPVSGMVILTLLVTTLIFVGLGWVERIYLVMAMTVGSVVGVSIAMAGDTSQDLKTGFLVGATPRLQQIGALVGVIVPSIVIAWALLLLNQTYGFGSKELPAPQATLMASIVDGVINKSLPYGLVGIGIVIGIVVELLGIRSLPFALGLYLPLSTSLAIGLGGALHWITGAAGHQRGVLVGSGLIAGDALTGIAIALLAVTGLLNVDKPVLLDRWMSLAAYLVLAILFSLFVKRRRA